MAIIILVMDMTKTKLVMLYGIDYDGSTDIDGMWLYPYTKHKKKIKKNKIREKEKGH